MLLPSAALKSALPPSSAHKFALYRRAVVPTLLVLSSLLAGYATPVYAQQNSDVTDVIRVSTDLLLFPVRIRDRRGQAVAGLTERDLSLKDPDNIASGLYFSQGTDRVAMLFALDQSGSLREVISQQRDAALALFERFGERSSVAILRFAEIPYLVTPFNRDTAVARQAFGFSATPNHRTAIFDAAAKAVETFDALPPARTERRLVVLISDGLDNASQAKPARVINAAVEKGVSFYVIHLPLFEPREGRLAVRSATKGFRDLAEKTGGKYFLAGDARSALATRKYDLNPVFQAIEEDLKSQYLLGFYIGESSKDGRKHVLSVSLIPPATEYSVGQFGYSRTHKFSVNLAPNADKPPQ